MLQIDNECFSALKTYFCNSKTEQGGILGFRTDLNHITDFYPDTFTCSSSKEYRISSDLLNIQIHKWAKNDIYLCGIVHSHVSHENKLSRGDRIFIEKQLISVPQYPFLWFPVVLCTKDKWEICFFKCYRDSNKVIIYEEEHSII